MTNSKLNKLAKRLSSIDAETIDGVETINRNRREMATSVPVQVENGAVKEINGPKGLEPTRYGDWESKGRCYDF